MDTRWTSELLSYLGSRTGRTSHYRVVCLPSPTTHATVFLEQCNSTTWCPGPWPRVECYLSTSTYSTRDRVLRGWNLHSALGLLAHRWIASVETGLIQIGTTRYLSCALSDSGAKLIVLESSAASKFIWRCTLGRQIIFLPLLGRTRA